MNIKLWWISLSWSGVRPYCLVIKFSDVLYKISNFVSDVTCVDDFEYSEKDFIYLDELIYKYCLL